MAVNLGVLPEYRLGEGHLPAPSFAATLLPSRSRDLPKLDAWLWMGEPCHLQGRAPSERSFDLLLPFHLLVLLVGIRPAHVFDTGHFCDTGRWNTVLLVFSRDDHSDRVPSIVQLPSGSFTDAFSEGFSEDLQLTFQPW